LISTTRSQRAALFFVSASAYLAWYSGFGEPLEAQGIAGAPAPSLTIVPKAIQPHVSRLIMRDPFAGAPERSAPNDASSRSPSTDGASVTIHTNAMVPKNLTSADDMTTGFVPDIASARDTANAVTLVVKATIVGRNPVAYVANGTMMDIVRVGDRLGDRRVAKIDIRGIVFSDGTRLDLPGAFVPTPPPAAAGSAITIKLDDLRRLLKPNLQQSLSAPPHRHSAGAAPAAVAPASTEIFPTPGSLPTIDARGIPAGTNPTPNASGPTPYPNPYPYAPPAAPHH